MTEQTGILFGVKADLWTEIWKGGMPTGVLLSLERLEVYEAVLISVMTPQVEIILDGEEVVYVPIDNLLWEVDLLPGE